MLTNLTMHLASVKWHFSMSKVALFDQKRATFQIANYWCPLILYITKEMAINC